MTDKKAQESDTCGCCELPAGTGGKSIVNRPGLDALRYRVGTYADIRRAMLEAAGRKRLTIGGEEYRPLQDWSVRDSEDYGIACLEMWAYLGDVLTFYQERIANEAFLGTAHRRESLVRLAASVNYRPSPGRAASADLAFTLDEDAELTIPAGLKLQSKPGPGEKPQKFETMEALDAVYALNRMRVLPSPVERDPLAKESSWGILHPQDDKSGARPLAPGDPLVIFNEKNGRVEQKQLEALEEVDWYTRLSWSPQVNEDLKEGRVFRWIRRFSLFGHNAPETQLQSEPDPGSPLVLKWAKLETDFSLSKGSSLALDGVYDEISVGDQVLVTGLGGKNNAVLCCLTAVDQGPETLCTAVQSGTQDEVMTGTVTRIKLDAELPADVQDLRTVSVYLLEGPEINFWDRSYDSSSLAKGVDSFYLAGTKPPALKKGRVLILADGEAPPQRVEVTNIEPKDFDRVEHHKVELKPPLLGPLDGSKAVLYGNIVRATHGETIAEEVLGSGDASKAFQRFTLKKAPVTYEPDSRAAAGAVNSLELRVDGVRWHEEASLYGQDGDVRVYVTESDEEGKMTVRFGDGESGARPSSGRNNLVARYRQGIGKQGEVGAQTLTNLLDRPKGLKGVTNPRAAFGAADAEDASRIRELAPEKVRIFDRIVSLRDFADAARSYSGVAKASAVLHQPGQESAGGDTQQREQPSVLLFVAGEGGDPLQPGALADLRGYLDERRDPNRALQISDADRVSIGITAELYVDADYLGDQVRDQAEAALRDRFAFTRRELGQPIHLSDVYEVLDAVPGVVGAKVLALLRSSPEVKKPTPLTGTWWGTGSWWSGGPWFAVRTGMDILPVDADGLPSAHIPVQPNEIAFVDPKGEGLNLSWETAS